MTNHRVHYISKRDRMKTAKVQQSNLNSMRILIILLSLLTCVVIKYYEVDYRQLQLVYKILRHLNVGFLSGKKATAIRTFTCTFFKYECEIFIYRV